MRVIITPAELNINPVLGGSCSIILVLLLVKECRLRYLPLEGCEKKDVCTGRVHLVRLSRVNRFLLDSFYLERVELHVEDLAEVHYNRLVDLLPKMGAEDLNERYL